MLCQKSEFQISAKLSAAIHLDGAMSQESTGQSQSRHDCEGTAEGAKNKGAVKR
jgi:hypothetical protein